MSFAAPSLKAAPPPPLADADLGNAEQPAVTFHSIAQNTLSAKQSCPAQRGAAQPASQPLVSKAESSAEQSASTGRVAGSNGQRGEQPAVTSQSIADVNQLLKNFRHCAGTLCETDQRSAFVWRIREALDILELDVSRDARPRVQKLLKA